VGAVVTFFVGENGTGKSTVIEAIAALCRLPVSGGGRNEDLDSSCSTSWNPPSRLNASWRFWLRCRWR
jgi:predicted ATPase